ncbi:MAG: hypothetical protein ACREFQ_04585, partial [Stellaceae bacterium]
MAEPERRRPRFAAPEVAIEQLPDGGMILRSPQPLGPAASHLGDKLAHWAAAAPRSLFLAEREGAGWRRLAYAEAH